MFIEDLMGSPVVTVSADDTAGHAARLMHERGLHALPVFDGESRLAGILTSSDLADNHDPDEIVATLMTPEVRTIEAYMTVADAAREMLRQRIHHLVVLRHGDVAGVLTSFDMVKLVAAEHGDAGTPPGDD